MTKVSGFTFIKNGVSLGFPFVESIKSISPLCDEVVINIGYDNPELDKDDGTESLIRKTFADSKYKIVKSFWNPESTKEGLILSEQTNIALKECSGDVCFYIQGDEAIHEEDYPLFKEAIKKLTSDDRLDGIVFDYIHFYGNVDIYKFTRNVYRREVRLIKNHRGIISWKDAQGFKTKELSKLSCTRSNARIFHYGWARQEMVMAKKVDSFGKLYHGKEHSEKGFRYEKIWGLYQFKKTHPSVMKNWIERNRNNVDLLNLKMKFEWKNVGLAISDSIEKLTGYRIGEYKNYKLV